MNTPTHLIVNYALLEKETTQKEKWWILAGGFIPDITIYFMFFWAFAAGIDQQTLWREVYFQPEWQAIKNVFNSVPLALLILTAGVALKKRWLSLFSISLLIHFVLDFFTHANDGHAHFYPLTNWIYQSPLSYWDKGANAELGGAIELALLSICVIYLLPRLRTWWTKTLVIGAWLFSVLGSLIAPIIFSL